MQNRVEITEKRIQEITEEIWKLREEREHLYELEIESLGDTYASYIGRTYYADGVYYRIISIGGFCEDRPAFNCLIFSNEECWGWDKANNGSRFYFGLGLNGFGVDNSITIEDLKTFKEIPFLEFREAFDENCKRLLNLSDIINKED